MAQPEVSVLVSSFERPHHLRRVLESLAVQKGVQGLMEVVVTDDGSRDETPQVVQEFAAGVDFPVRFRTHPHAGFQLARCRNEGVRASTAPYLLFLDGDCLAPPDHLRTHLERRRAGLVRGGFCAHLNREISQQIGLAEVRSGIFTRRASLGQRWALLKRDLSWRLSRWRRHATRPKLFGGNIGIWRSDFERVNGYDENFIGWGCEDDDLRLRLRRAGLQVESILRWTNTFHLWHPKAPSTPARWREGDNVAYLNREVRLTRCGNGLAKRSVRDLELAVAGDGSLSKIAAQLPPGCILRRGPAEIEIVLEPGSGTFSATADCRIIWMTSGDQSDAVRAGKAHYVVSERPAPGLEAPAQIRPQQFQQLLQSLLTRPPQSNLAAA